MENNYKTFMDKQHPSEALIAETISKAKELSTEENVGEGSHGRRFRRKTESIRDFCNGQRL